MGGMGFFRLGVWQNFMRARRGGYQGNMIGEGFVLGGVFVIGPGDQVSHQFKSLSGTTEVHVFFVVM